MSNNGVRVIGVGRVAAAYSRAPAAGLAQYGNFSTFLSLRFT